MLIKNISVVIIVKNSENTIKRTLNSLVDFCEVIVYDNGSTDETINIAKSVEYLSAFIISSLIEL